MTPIRTVVRQLHLWLGLSLGALFALLGATGSVLVFYEDIDALLHPEIRIVSDTPAPGWDSPVWDRALATLRARWPERDGSWRFELTDRTGPIPVRYQSSGEGHHGHRVMVWLSPDGRQVLREADWGAYAMTWIYNLHMDLLQHAPGRAVVGWSGVATLVLLLSGLWAWWPKGSWRKALQYKGDAAASRRLRDLHKLAGLASLPLLLMLAGTGAMMSLPKQSDALLGHTLGPVTRAKTPVSPSKSASTSSTSTSTSTSASAPSSHRPQEARSSRINVAQALATAQSAMPQGRIVWFEMPGAGPGVFFTRVRQPGDPSRRFPQSYVYVDPVSGELLGSHDRAGLGTSDKVNNWLHPLHDGSSGGLWLRIPLVFVGLAPLALFVTGLMRWRLLRRSRATPARTKRPPLQIA